MGFLKRMFGGGEPTLEDRIWMRSDLKTEDAVRRIAADARNDGVACIAVFHFSGTGEGLRSRLEAAGVACDEAREPDATQLEALPARVGPRSVGLLHSGGLPPEVKLGQAKRSARGGGRPCRVHLVEHYPMLYRDTHVLNLHAVLPEGSTFFGYAALDEAWLGRDLNSAVVPLLRRLGLDESEPLEHAMLSGAVRKAQERLGRRLRKSEQHADSLEEWTRLNLGD